MMARSTRVRRIGLQAIAIMIPLSAFSLSCYAQDGAENALSLDGTWQIVFDTDNEGKQKEWFGKERFPEKRARKSSVPAATGADTPKT